MLLMSVSSEIKIFLYESNFLHSPSPILQIYKIKKENSLAHSPASVEAVWVKACARQMCHKLNLVNLMSWNNFTSIYKLLLTCLVGASLRCVQHYETLEPNRPLELYKFLHGGEMDVLCGLESAVTQVHNFHQRNTRIPLLSAAAAPN